jgi:hypothetical protein
VEDLTMTTSQIPVTRLGGVDTEISVTGAEELWTARSGGLGSYPEAVFAFQVTFFAFFFFFA